jgi:hypothetical protein
MAQIEVEPGYLIQDNEPLTYAKLRAMAQPVVSLTTEFFNQLSSFKNGFVNGNLTVWQRGTASLACGAATKKWLADRWFVRPTGATCTQIQSTSIPSGAISAYSVKITGAASVTTVDFGQRIESADSYSNWLRTRTFSAYIYNDTGSSFTPNLRINTPSAADNYATNTNRLNATLQACPSGGWTQVSYTFDGSTYTNMGNGCEVVIQIPDGSLSSTGKSVYITQLQCEPGSVVTAQEPRLVNFELQLCQRYALKLANQVVGFAADATNLPNKGILTYPTTMRIKPVFNGNNSATADNTNDFYTATAGSNGTPIISGYAAEAIFACANAAANWTVGAQINITCVLTAEDQT